MKIFQDSNEFSKKSTIKTDSLDLSQLIGKEEKHEKFCLKIYYITGVFGCVLERKSRRKIIL
jgi:hypothetical protein